MLVITYAVHFSRDNTAGGGLNLLCLYTIKKDMQFRNY